RDRQGSASRAEEDIFELNMAVLSNYRVPESAQHAGRSELRIAGLRADPDRLRMRVLRRVRSCCDRQPQPLCGLSGASLADVRGNVEDDTGPGAPVRLR